LAVRQGRKRRLDRDAVTPAVPHARLPLVPRHGRRRHRERTLERDLLLALVIAPHRIILRRAHRERAGRQHDQLRAFAALLEGSAGRRFGGLWLRRGSGTRLRKHGPGGEREDEGGQVKACTSSHYRSPMTLFRTVA